MVHLFYYLLLVDQLPATQPYIDSGVDYFWQIIASIFGSILLWIFKRDLDRRDKRVAQMSEAITTLQTSHEIMANDVERIRDDLDKLMEGR